MVLSLALADTRLFPEFGQKLILHRICDSHTLSKAAKLLVNFKIWLRLPNQGNSQPKVSATKKQSETILPEAGFIHHTNSMFDNRMITQYCFSHRTNVLQKQIR
jgi:hypothetical protein